MLETHARWIAYADSTTNANIGSGEIEILCHEIEVLHTSVTPPFQLDDENLSENVRLTHRVIDLRRPQMRLGGIGKEAPVAQGANGGQEEQRVAASP